MANWISFICYRNTAYSCHEFVSPRPSFFI